jgi:tRNA A-37 threonylcarbamoyl transferase component Bud32
MTAKPIIENFRIRKFHLASLAQPLSVVEGCAQSLAATPSEFGGATQSLFLRRKLMGRAIERPLLWLDSDRASENSILVRSRAKTQGHILRIYCVGNLRLDEMLINLPELFLRKDCKTIKSEKKIRVVRLPLRIGPTVKSVYVKQHNALSFRHRLASFFCQSAALRSLSGAATLLKEGYATARPIAAVDYRRRGVLIQSFYLSEEIAGAKTISDYWLKELLSLTGIEGQLKRRAVLRNLARLIKSLHERRIYHNDLKASNILALDRGPAAGDMFSLIDVQGVRKCFYLSKRRRIKNLAQLNRTLGNHLSKTQKLFFLKVYGGDQISHRRKQRHLVRSILKETRRQIIRERLRHPTADNYPFPGVASAADL